MYTKCSAKFAVRLKRWGKSSWRSVQIADISWYFFRNVVVKNYKRKRWCSWVFPEQYDGTAPISILIVHKFQVKVSVCTARWRWGCGSSPAYNISLLSHFNGLDDGTSAHLGFIQPKQVWLTASGWKLHYMLARFQIWNCPGNIF